MLSLLKHLFRSGKVAYITQVLTSCHQFFLSVGKYFKIDSQFNLGDEQLIPYLLQFPEPVSNCRQVISLSHASTIQKTIPDALFSNLFP